MENCKVLPNAKYPTVDSISFTVSKITDVNAKVSVVFYDKDMNILLEETKVLGGRYFNDSNEPDFAFQRVLGQFNLNHPGELTEE